MVIGWEGERVRLVPLDRERHFEAAVEWMNDPEVTAWTEHGDLPLTRLAEEEWFRRAMAPPPTEVHFAIELKDGEPLGFTGLMGIERQNGVAKSGILIGPARFRGKGHGSDAIRVRTSYAFEVLNLRLLLTHVMADNEASLKALTRAGYRECGRVPRRYWKRGAWRDVIDLMLDRDDWAARRP